MSKATTGAFIGSLAVITWRELNNPPAGAPLPLPTPSRYIGAAIVYGILEFMADIWNPKISDALAIAYFVGLLISTAQTGIAHNAGGTSGSTPGGGTPIKPVPTNPNSPFNNPGLQAGPGFLPPDNGGLVPAPGDV